MNNNVTTEETKITLSVQQLEEVIRKVVREELVEFAAQELGIFHLDKESPLYEDMEDILERKKIRTVEISHTRRDLEWITIKRSMKTDSSIISLVTQIYANVFSEKSNRFLQIRMIARSVSGEFLVD
jgi:hypothetical protein